MSFRLLAWSLLQTRPEMRPLAILYSGQFWLPQTRFLILYVYYYQIDVLGVVWKTSIERIINRERENCKTTNVVILFEAGLFFSRGYFLKCSHLAIAAKLHCPKVDQISKSLLYIQRSALYGSCNYVSLIHSVWN